MDEQKTPDAYCPNCQKPAVREGNDIICTRCDATFKVTKTGAARVVKIGRLEDLERRQDDTESRLSILEGSDESPAETPAEQEELAPVLSEDEADIIPR